MQPLEFLLSFAFFVLSQCFCVMCIFLPIVPLHIFSCLFLFSAGLLARGLCAPYHVNRNIIQALIIFNPSLITLAHHAQSEIIFLLLMTTFLVCVNNVLKKCGDWRFGTFALLGLVAGLLPLARPLGFYFVLVAPLLMIFAFLMPKLENKVDWRRFAFGIILSVTVSAVTVAPWGIRNKAVFGQFSLTQSEGLMMGWHYQLLESYQNPQDRTAEQKLRFKRYMNDQKCSDVQFHQSHHITKIFKIQDSKSEKMIKS